jgi:hypothetical protein
LHACGSLTDKAIDLAIDNNAKLVCAPCCYGKFAASENHKFTLPRSKFIKRFFEKEYNSILDKTIRFNYGARANTAEAMLSQIYALLTNFDRALYLKEQGFYVTYEPFIPRICNTFSKHSNTPHNFLINAAPS